MKKEVLTAFMLWAIQTDQLGLPVQTAWEKFKQTAENIKNVYTDKSDPLLYIASLEDVDAVEMFTDYVLMYAKSDVISGIDSYGKYNEDILNYNYKK